MTIKGRLYSTMSNVKGVFGRKFQKSRQKRPQMAVFGVKMVVELNFWFCDPQLEAHSCAEPRLLAYIASISVLASWLLTISRTPAPKKRKK